MSDNQLKKNKKWHQKWWGIIVMFLVVLGLLFLAIYIYQVVYIIETGKFYEGETQTNTTRQDKLNYSAALRSIVETVDDPFYGNPEAKLVIVEFSDFQCPYCLDFLPILKALRQEYQDSVKFIYRDFPNIETHDQALNAAMAAECADDQGRFWQYHDLVFANQSNLSVANLKLMASQLSLNRVAFDECLDSERYKNEALNDLAEGLKIKVSGTPTFFINGNMFSGVVDYDTFKSVIDQSLEFLNNNDK